MTSVLSFSAKQERDFWSTVYLHNNTKQVINKSNFCLPRSRHVTSSPSVWLCDENTPTVHGADWLGQFNVRQSSCIAEETALRMIAVGQSIDSCKMPLYLDSSRIASRSILIIKECMQIPRKPRVSLYQSTAIVHS
jgi:hypothetical protein